MDTKENIGYIYKITNLVNKKVYIGQTSKTVEKRWNSHKNDYNRKNRESYNYPLYKAMRKYGIDNFKIEEIEQCEIEQLNEREIYWISFYDSYHNGYNATLGGGGLKLLTLNELEVINKYKELGVVNKVSTFFNCDSHIIASILNKHNINIKSSSEHQKDKGNKLYQYNKNNELMNVFKSRTEAGQWLLDNGYKKDVNKNVIGRSITAGLERNNHWYLGFYWKLENDFSEDKRLEIRNRRKELYFLKKDTEEYKLSIHNSCPICGEQKFKRSKLCNYCENKKRKDENLKEKEQKYNISRDILKEEIRTNSFLQIGKKYNVSDNAIRKWCKTYNLPYKSSEIKKYSDEEWENI